MPLIRRRADETGYLHLWSISDELQANFVLASAPRWLRQKLVEPIGIEPMT